MLKKKSKDDEDDEDDEVTRRVRAPVNISRVPAWSDPAPASILQGWWVFSSPRPRARDCRKPRKVTMGTVPFLVYSGVLVCDNPIGIYNIEEIQFWIVPGRCTTWEMGGSQFTMTLWTGLSQTTKNDNGRRAHSRFPWFATIPCMGSW